MCVLYVGLKFLILIPLSPVGSDYRHAPSCPANFFLIKKPESAVEDVLFHRRLSLAVRSPSTKGKLQAPYAQSMAWFDWQLRILLVPPLRHSGTHLFSSTHDNIQCLVLQGSVYTQRDFWVLNNWTQQRFSWKGRQWVVWGKTVSAFQLSLFPMSPSCERSQPRDRVRVLPAKLLLSLSWKRRYYNYVSVFVQALHALYSFIHYDVFLSLKKKQHNFICARLCGAMKGYVLTAKGKKKCKIEVYQCGKQNKWTEDLTLF